MTQNASRQNSGSTIEESKAHILLVDDDEPILEAVSDILKLSGYDVVTAEDGSSALVKMQSFLPDLIISDIMMPVMDGFTFFDTVRRNPAWVTIPFMFLTARGQKTDVRYGYEIGADDFIVKPFEAEDLVVKVDVRLRRVRAVRAAAEASADQMKDELLAVFGHELRTPLTYIYGYANLLRDSRETFDQESIEQMLDGIHLGADRLVRLTESLLLMVRIDSGMTALEIERRSTKLNLLALVNDAVQGLKEVTASARASINIQVPTLIDVWGVEYLLRDVITRLVDNAVRYSQSSPDARVGIKASTDRMMAILDVIDNGIGIAPQDIERIFERFVQIDREVMEQQGTGLGLAIARGLARQHGGDVQVTSLPGSGSTFRLTIPLSH